MAQRRASLRRQLLLGILVPVLALLLLNAFTLYRQALGAANTAYDRTLLASAKAIGELLVVEGSPAGQPQLQATLPYAALEAFEADNRSRMFYKVTGFNGEMASGFADLPPARAVGDRAQSSVYAALVQFYDDQYLGEPVRMAVLLQPVAGSAGQGMATIQVAETLELRHTLARGLLLQTLWQQLLLVAVIVAVVLWAVQRATAPVRALSEQLRTRAQTDLSPMQAANAPRELLPMVEATNALMARLAELLDLQRRFVRDASHQLRTPLSVLKAQVQSARRGDVEPQQHWPRSTPPWNAPPSWPTRCWRWPKWSRFAPAVPPPPTRPWWIGRTPCAQWHSTWRRWWLKSSLTLNCMWTKHGHPAKAPCRCVPTNGHCVS